MQLKKYIFIAVFFASILIAGNPVSVPLWDPVYRFLDRVETLGYINNLLDGVRPFDREHIAQILIKIAQKRAQLTTIDQEKLDNFLLDYRFEINRTDKYAQIEDERTTYSPFSSWSQFKKDFLRFFSQNQPEEENHLFLWEDSSNSFYLDFLYEFTFDKRDDGIQRNKDIMTFSLRGTLYDDFGYRLDVEFATLRGDREYRNQDPYLKSTWRNDRENVTYFDRSGGDISYRTPYVDLRFAMQPVTWGVGESGTLILSDNVEQYPYLSISKYWGWGSFTFLHGKLLSEQTGTNEKGQAIHPDKWLVANRFEFSPFNGMAIGLNGLIIYGNRSADWAYLFPINYFRAIEHNLRDRDNAILAVDLESRLFDGTKIYGTLFIDELRQDKIGTDWYGNKHGFQLGLHLADLFRIPNITARFEYVAVMPWVYTHKYNVNRYIHDMRSLGYWAGPNSQVVYLHLEKEWHRRLRTGLKWRQWKHGRNYSNENIGGDILLGHNVLLGEQEKPRETRKFLEGILETDERFNFYAQYEVFNDFYLDFSYTHIKYVDPDVQSNLNEIHFGFKLDY